MKKVILVSALGIGSVAFCLGTLSKQFSSMDSQLLYAVEALTLDEDPAGGTCCSRENDVCIVGAVKLPGQYLSTKPGPC